MIRAGTSDGGEVREEMKPDQVRIGLSLGLG